MEEGQIILVKFPQDREAKLRPALILRKFPKYGDILVCAITSNLNQFIPDLGIVLNEGHPDYKLSGLKKASVCKLNMLSMFSEEYIKGSIGSLSKETHIGLLKSLAAYLVHNN